MAFGVQTFNASGGVTWDSTLVLGGVVVDQQRVAAATAATFTYPAHAGRSAFLVIDFDAGTSAGVPSVVLDTALGYPRVTVASAPGLRQFLVCVL